MTSVSLGMPSAPPPVLAPRRKTRQIKVGSVGVGSDSPISVQSMTTTPTHDVNASLNASLPLGFFISGQMSYNSGRFYTITTGRDDNRDSRVNDRPVGGLPNTERGPKYLNFDFNISKAFFIRRAAGSASGMNVNVFANMTNAFNHVHYGTPSGVMTSRNFRRITSASNPREIEIGLRFQF